MSKPQLKFLIFVVAGAVLLPLSFIGFSLLTHFVTEFNRGAEPASIFHGHTLMIPAQEQANWLPEPETYTGFVPSQAEREEIIAAYWEAWEALARACLTNDNSALPTNWAGGAFRQVQSIVQCRKDTTLEHEGHQLQLNFFSDDGSVVAFTDQAFHLRYSVAGITDDLRVTAEITMTLDVGAWRIRQMETMLKLT